MVLANYHMDAAGVERNIVANVLTYDLCGGNCYVDLTDFIEFTYRRLDQNLWQNFTPICL